MIRPILTYAAPVWFSAAHTHFKILQRYQTKCLRLILLKNRYIKTTQLRSKSSLTYFIDYVEQLATSFYKLHLDTTLLSRT